MRPTFALLRPTFALLRLQLLRRPFLCRPAFIVAALSGALACSGSNAVSNTPVLDFGAFNDAQLEIVAEGGIAALSSTQRVSHLGGAFVTVARHLCATTCPAPLDSAAGQLDGPRLDMVFNLALDAKRSLRDDYGTTPLAADMMQYTVRIASDGSVKTIRADDGTMPALLRQLVDSARAAIASARR